MFRFCFSIWIASLCGCGKNNDPQNAILRPFQPQAQAYFQTSWQDESQFIVESIICDVAEMAYFAQHKALPAASQFSVAAKETAASPLDTPIYNVEICFDSKTPTIKAELNIAHPIWSPENYAGLVKKIFATVGFTPQGSLHEPKGAETELLDSLVDLTSRSLLEKNKVISDALSLNFRKPTLHEQAAMLVGAFVLREHSGAFHEIRSPLCRLAAHLAMARYLAGEAKLGLNGQFAEVILFAMMNQQQAALEKLKLLESVSPTSMPWVRALKARITHDYRELASLSTLTRLEKIEGFQAACQAIAPNLAWEKVTDEDKSTCVDYSRIMHAEGYSVQVGHQLQAVSLPLELAEIDHVYSQIYNKKLTTAQFVEALNQIPERCFTVAAKPRVQVLGWGQWAMFSQRHLCHTLQNNFGFLMHSLGVPNEAKRFFRQTEAQYGKLRLYPFVRRFNCFEINEYHRSVDDGFAVTVQTPHLVSAYCWNYLCYRPSFTEAYKPNPNPHINEWHKHNPPPFTAYDPYARMDHPSLIRRPDVVAQLEKLHQIAPYNYTIASRLLQKKYDNQANVTFAQVAEVYQPVLEYDVHCLAIVAEAAGEQPAEYEKLMQKAAAINPYHYYALANYFCQADETKAATYLEKATELYPDAVKSAQHAAWRIKYYQRHGKLDKAMQLADEAAAVYSYSGLRSKAELLESLGKYDEALDFYQKIDTRYSRFEVAAFAKRYNTKTGDSRYDSELVTGLKTLFPKGLESAMVAQFNEAPQDGVMVKGNKYYLQMSGLYRGDIIVALNGVRVHNVRQYAYLRDSEYKLEPSFILWRTNQYMDFKFKSPDHREISVDFESYRAR